MASSKLGDFFRDFVAGEAHALGVAASDLRSWTSPTAPKRTTIDRMEVYVALQRWTREPDEEPEDAEDVELPEGPAAAELASGLVRQERS